MTILTALSSISVESRWNLSAHVKLIVMKNLSSRMWGTYNWKLYFAIFGGFVLFLFLIYLFFVFWSIFPAWQTPSRSVFLTDLFQTWCGPFNRRVSQMRVLLGGLSRTSGEVITNFSRCYMFLDIKRNIFKSMNPCSFCGVLTYQSYTPRIF